jgi:hypothetical protein
MPVSGFARLNAEIATGAHHDGSRQQTEKE